MVMICDAENESKTPAPGRIETSKNIRLEVINAGNSPKRTAKTIIALVDV